VPADAGALLASGPCRSHSAGSVFALIGVLAAFISCGFAILALPAKCLGGKRFLGDGMTEGFHGQRMTLEKHDCALEVTSVPGRAMGRQRF
jgi:hypothetical protein